jgi:hypothetical protein
MATTTRVSSGVFPNPRLFKPFMARAIGSQDLSYKVVICRSCFIFVRRAASNRECGNRSSTHVKNKLLSFIKGKAGNIRDLLPWAFGFS